MVAALVALAEQVELAHRRDAMSAGDHINVTEDRAVLHTALRRPATDGARGRRVRTSRPYVHEVLDKIYAFADQVRSGAWKGVTGQPIATVVNIGIGGSDLGPVMVYEALKPYVQQGISPCRFISNIDPCDLAEKVADLDPDTTLFIVASKTFTTLETLTNARMARAWLLALCSLTRARFEDSDEARKGRRRQALRRRLDGPGQGRGVRHRPRERVRVLGLGGVAATRSTPRSGPRSRSRSGRTASADFLDGFHQVDEHFAHHAVRAQRPRC